MLADTEQQNGVDLREKRASVRVLIVDDHRDAAESAAALLALRGFTVETAFSGEDALARARATPIDVAFLDLGMPVMDGYATAAAFRADPALGGVTLIALTGWGSIADRARTHAAGFAFHLEKPATLERLEEVIFDALVPAAPEG